MCKKFVFDKHEWLHNSITSNKIKERILAEEASIDNQIRHC